MTNIDHCPLCNRNCDSVYGPEGRDAYVIRCQRCGEYLITRTLLVNKVGDLRPYVSCHTRQEWDLGRRAELTTANVQEMAAAHQNVGVPQKIEKHLRYVAGRSQFPGDLVPIQGDVDYPLFDCTTSQELEFIADHVRVKGYLDQRKPHGEAILTVAGWDYIQPTLRPGGEPDRCFIAMAFQAGLAEAYTIGIKPAVEECGFRAIRIDELSTNEGITDRILAEIRRAHFVVADFTLQRGGVYFEAGFARGLGREVIWCCRADDLCNVHFDVKHFGHVVWEGPDELREKLTASIRANIIPQG